MKILILNGPNLNLQGRRDVAVYGSTAFEEYLTRLRAVFPDVGLDCFQSHGRVGAKPVQGGNEHRADQFGARLAGKCRRDHPHGAQRFEFDPRHA